MNKLRLTKPLCALIILMCIVPTFVSASETHASKLSSVESSVQTFADDSLKADSLHFRVDLLDLKESLNEDVLRKFPQLNVADFLQGTVAGLEVLNSTSGVGGSVAVTLRGQRSLSEKSTPLFVIDGIPMVNNLGEQPNMWGGLDEGDGLSQINPDDIASIEFIKGTSGAVLYGSQAANGVVLITTKTAKDEQLRVILNSTTLFEKVIWEPELQFKYGTDAETESWSMTAGNYPDNYVSDYFGTGMTAQNSIAISGGGKNSTLYATFANTSAKGVVENNRYQRNNFALRNVSHLFQNRLNIQAGISYADETVKNRYATGYYLNPLTGLYLFPRNGGVPINDMALGRQPFSYFKSNYSIPNTYTSADEQNWFVYDHLQSNPYWLLNKQPQEDQTQRLLANLSAEFKLSGDFDLQVRSGYDYADKSFEQQYYDGGNPINIGTNGRWRYKKYTDKLIYLDGSLTYHHRFNKLGVEAVAGANYKKTDFNNGYQIDSGITGLNSPNIFTEDNLPSNIGREDLYHWELEQKGIYASVALDYNRSLILELGLRNDVTSSIISEGHEAHWFPTAKLSTLLNEWINFPAVVSHSQVYISASSSYRDLSSSLMQLYGHSAITSSNSVGPTDDLSPEKIKAWEAGTNWSFWNNNLSVDLAYYQTTNSDQASLRSASATQQSFYLYIFVNMGDIVNKGFEATVAAKPITGSDLNWQTKLNFYSNTSEVKDLASNNESYFVDLGSTEGYYSRVYAGGKIGDLYGYKFLRNESGQLVLDESTGTPRKTSSIEYLGNLNPDFCLGWGNSLNYKNISLDLQLNANIGGKAFSQTESMLDGYGVSQRSAAARDKGYVAIDGIQGETLVTQIDPELYYTTVGGRNGIGENYLYDRTNIRLAQAALAYHFNVESLGLPLKAASVSLVGNNLFFLYKKAPFDPEMALSTGLGSQSMDSFSVPASRMYGFNLRVTF
ncbi:SusC/RagA family TonB-linked outer membrane protein [Mangrovibacterium diazotrophicum]|uniref:TonB-linked SusC/RagA family outer membrane protein n=1 Tax=Mangrovibacterium diazotrophicum TaxID=1261403 RepID=A0A419W5L7_9BACT|nr:SusC/RagA family TonB-linked outer membrane protein [Mangrovibacterium diazotrophicum]RKD90753.1 TonB-linked SusC/RagA family outer membrane protein [Mangrovibacterium diazotrophicum]